MLVCCVVLWRSVECCAVVCCGVLWGVGVTFFVHFLTKKRITFHDVCFSKPLTFHNDFMFFLLLAAVSSTVRDNKPYLRCEMCRACCLEKCLKQLREAKIHEIIVEGQRLRKADIMEGNSFFREKMSKKVWSLVVILTCTSFYTFRSACFTQGS